MPFIKADTKLIYFIHIPKCAGSAVEAYLGNRFGSLAFKDAKFLQRPVRNRWSKSSPQHIPLEDLKHLIPLDYFDAMFAIVRHPIDRLASVYLFQREVETKIASDVSFTEWLDQVQTLRGRSPYAFDNHVRPAIDFLPGKAGRAKIFRLEDGLIPVVHWLDAHVGQSEGPRRIPTKQSRDAWHLFMNLPKPEFQLTPDERERVYDMYTEDFDRFGYSLSDGTKY